MKLVLRRSPTTLLTARLLQKTWYDIVENLDVASHAVVANRVADTAADMTVVYRLSLGALPGLHRPSSAGLSGQQAVVLILA